MSETSQVPGCDRCGAALSGPAQDRLCAACLLESAIVEPGVVGASPTQVKPVLAFGDYELLEEIARGGMGVVYRARQVSLNRPVAVKMILGGPLVNAAEMKRFRAEAEMAAQLQHPNIVAIHEVGEYGGQPFFSMDLVEGRNLAQLIREEPLPSRQAASYLKTIAEAVHYAHSRGVLHRDLKPSNVLIDENDQPRLTDFGLAKRLSGTQNLELTQTGQVLGSPSFIPPEQAAGQRNAIGPATDVYSLGAILYHLLTGRPPFLADSVPATLRMAAETEPVAPRLLNPSIPPDLATICLKCLEKDPLRRYGSASELAAELDRFLRDEPIHARPASSVERAQRWIRRKPALASAMALVLVVAIGSPIAALWINRARLVAERARHNEARLRKDAQEAQKAAEGARVLAEEARQQMLGEKRIAQHASYVASLGLADRFINERRYDDARSLLESCAAELRGWEWDRLSFLCRLGSVTLAGHSNQVWSIAFSSDGTQVATAGLDGSVRTWDPQTGGQRKSFQLNGGASCVAFSPDGNALAAGCYDGTATVWDTKTWGQIARLEKHDERIFTLAYSPDGRTIATGGGHYQKSRDNTIRFWDARSGKSLRQLSGHQQCVYALRFDPSGSHLISGAQDGVRLWDLKDFRQEKQISSACCRALALTPDGHVLAMALGHDVVLHDLTLDRQTSFNADDTVWSLAISRDGRKLIAGVEDNTVLLLDLPDLRLNSTLRGHSARVVSVAFSPDGGLVGSASTDGTARVWRTGSMNDRLVIPAHAGLVEWIAISPDGHLLASASDDGTVKLWDLERRKALQTWKTPEPLPALSVAFSGNGARLALALGTNAIVWDLAQRREISRISGWSKGFRAVSLDQEGHTLATACWQNQAHLWNADTGERLWASPESITESWSAAFRPYGTEVALGGLFGIGFLNPANGEVFPSHKWHQRTVSCVAYSPRGDLFGSAGWDGYINVFDVATRKPICAIKGLPWSNVVIGFSPDSRRLVSVAGRNDWDPHLHSTNGQQSTSKKTSEARLKELRVWEVNSGLDLLSLHGDSPPICAAFSPNGKIIASGGEDGNITLWLTQPEPVYEK